MTQKPRKPLKTLISIRVAKPTLEQILRLVAARGETQTEVISQAVNKLYEEEFSRLEKQIMKMIFEFSATLPEEDTRAITLTKKKNAEGELIVTLSKDGPEDGESYVLRNGQRVDGGE